MRRLQILRGQLQYKPELKDGEFFLDKTNHTLLIGDTAVADGQFELAKVSAITNLQQQVDTKITNPSTKSDGQVLTYDGNSSSWVAKTFDISDKADIDLENVEIATGAWHMMNSGLNFVPYTASLSTTSVVTGIGQSLSTSSAYCVTGPVGETSPSLTPPKTSEFKVTEISSSLNISSPLYCWSEDYIRSGNDLIELGNSGSPDYTPTFTKVTTLSSGTVLPRRATSNYNYQNVYYAIVGGKLCKFDTNSATFNEVEGTREDFDGIESDMSQGLYAVTTSGEVYNVTFGISDSATFTLKGTLPSDVSSHKLVVVGDSGQAYVYGKKLGGRSYATSLYHTSDKFATFTEINLSNHYIPLPTNYFESGWFIGMRGNSPVVFISSSNYDGNYDEILAFNPYGVATTPYSEKITVASANGLSIRCVSGAGGYDYFTAFGSYRDTTNYDYHYFLLYADPSQVIGQSLIPTPNIITQLVGAGMALKSDIPSGINTLEIQQNGTAVGNFRAMSGESYGTHFTANIDVPVTSVNSKTGAVVLTAADVGALPDTTSIPTKTSDITNDSGFITSTQAPVQSVDGATGAVTTNAVKYTTQTLTDAQKTQARTNIGAGTSSFSGSYNDLNDKPTIPSKTSDLANDSNYITSAGAPVQSVNNKTGAVTLAASDVGAVPTTRTVNGKALSANITLNASDVGALPSTTKIPTYTLTKDETSTDYAAVYHLNNGTEDVGVPINIPKDLFVESGEIVDNPTGQPEGRYIKLVLQNQTDPIYINVADLVDAYTAGSGITISDTNVISANVSAGNGLSVDANGIKMGAASGTSAGAMSSADFTKLSSIEAGAQKNTVTSVNGSTGAVTITVPTKVTDLTDAANYATVTSVNTVADDVEMLNDEVGTLTTDVSTLKTNITSKQNTITGGASTITDNNLTANRALVSNSNGKVAVSDITATELGYLDGVTSNIQTQIDGLDDSVLLGTVEGGDVTLPSSAYWHSPVYGNGKFVTIATTSNSNKAAYSNDGIVWQSTTLPSSGYWNSLVYGNGKFVALVSRGTSLYNKAAYSEDGITWTAATLPNTGVWATLAYGNGVFVTVDNGSSNVAYSTDGVTWTVTTLPSSANWNSIAYGNGKFVIAVVGSQSYSNKAAYSTNGIDWTATTLYSSSSSHSGLRYVGNKFFALYYDSSNYIEYSEDGINWNRGSLPSSADWYDVSYGNGVFVVVARGSNKAAYSSDGVTWTATTLPSSYQWASIAYNNKFVVVSDSNVAAYSLDGITWNSTNLPSSGGWTRIKYLDNKFIVFKSTSSNAVIYSKDGIAWSNENISHTLTSTTGTDITSSVYSALEPYIPTPTVPTKTSELTNDSGYITQSDGDDRYLKLSGGMLNGNTKVVNGKNITFYADETGEETYVSMYMDSNYDLVISGSATGGDSVGRLKMYNVMTPTNSYMAANKYYVDQYAPHATLITLSTSGWSSSTKTQTVTVSGILADESKQLIIPMPAAASMTAYNDAGIQCTGQAANRLTFTATTVPTTAISVYVTYQAVIS